MRSATRSAVAPGRASSISECVRDVLEALPDPLLRPPQDSGPRRPLGESEQATTLGMGNGTRTGTKANTHGGGTRGTGGNDTAPPPFTKSAKASPPPETQHTPREEVVPRDTTAPGQRPQRGATPGTHGPPAPGTTPATSTTQSYTHQPPAAAQVERGTPKKWGTGNGASLEPSLPHPKHQATTPAALH